MARCSRTGAAAPVGAVESIALVEREADAVACLVVPHHFDAVGRWYRSFDRVDDQRVIDLISMQRLA